MKPRTKPKPSTVYSKPAPDDLALDRISRHRLVLFIAALRWRREVMDAGTFVEGGQEDLFVDECRSDFLRGAKGLGGLRETLAAQIEKALTSTRDEED